MTRIEKILSSGVINAITHPSFLYDITHTSFFTFKGVDDNGEFILIGYIAETGEKNAIVNGKKCSVFDLDLFVDNKVVEHFC